MCRVEMPGRMTEEDHWIRVGPRVQRNLVIEAEGLRMVRYRIAPGHRVALHKHRGGQIGVIVVGGGLHRFVLEIERGGRRRRVTTEIPVHAGDCYYIPPNVPHSFDADPRRATVVIDIMIRPTRAATAPRTPRAGELRVPTQRRGPG